MGQGIVDMKLASPRQGQREMRDVFVFSCREDKVVWKALFLEEMAEKCAKNEKPYKVIVQGSRVLVNLRVGSTVCISLSSAVLWFLALAREAGLQTYTRAGTRGSFTRACLAHRG